MRQNRRTFIAAGTAVAASVAAGGTWWALREGDDPKGASDRIDLLAGAYAGPVHQSDLELYAMLSLSGGMPKRTTMELRIFGLDATPVSPPDDIAVTLANLVTGEATAEITLTRDGDAWTLEQTAIQSDGWWQVQIAMGSLSASWTFLLPDPNLTGFDTPPAVETDPDAQAMLSATLNVLSNHVSLRWWEWLSGGNGAIILARFSVTTPDANGLPPSFESDSMLAGRIPMDGTAPSFREDNPRSVTIGDEGLKYIAGATPVAQSAVQYLPIAQYHTTYASHDGVHFGIKADIEGRACQLVAFHLPGAIEAWFAFWIDIETLELRELFMHSVNHYMHWVYYDIDSPFELTF